MDRDYNEIDFVFESYDQQIAFLTKHPNQIRNQWGKGIGLFQEATKEGGVNPKLRYCGCLTQIRGHTDIHAETEELTARIRADSRIPLNEEEITLESLPVFKEWQELLDSTIRKEQ